MPQIKNGDRVRDSITGYEGIVIATTDWLFNCRRFTVQRTGFKADGSLFETVAFDEGQLELVTSSAPTAPVDHGGPMPTPTLPRL